MLDELRSTHPVARLSRALVVNGYGDAVTVFRTSDEFRSQGAMNLSGVELDER